MSSLLKQPYGVVEEMAIQALIKRNSLPADMKEHLTPDEIHRTVVSFLLTQLGKGRPDTTGRATILAQNAMLAEISNAFPVLDEECQRLIL